MIRRPPRSTQSRSSAASDVYKRQKESTSPTERCWKRARGRRISSVLTGLAREPCCCVPAQLSSAGYVVLCLAEARSGDRLGQSELSGLRSERDPGEIRGGGHALVLGVAGL